MEALVLRRFENLIRARSGLNMREQEWHLLSKTLTARMQALRFKVPDRYLDFLSSDRPEAQSEWNQLFVLLTNQESYFFRDRGQLAVIRQHILTELIQHRSNTRTLGSLRPVVTPEGSQGLGSPVGSLAPDGEVA